MKLITYIYIIIFLIFSSHCTFAQTISFKGCTSLLEDSLYTLNRVKINSDGRNVFETQSYEAVRHCGGIGTCDFKIIFNNIANRWELHADAGNGGFVETILLYYCYNATLPNPPSLNYGLWEENTLITESQCSGTLTTLNGILTGAVQDVDTLFTVADSVKQISCNSSNNGAIYLFPIGGVDSSTFIWVKTGTINDTLENNTNILDSIGPGSYLAIITNGSTVIEKNFILTEPSILHLEVDSSIATSCYGISNGIAKVKPATGGNGGYTYDWLPDTPDGDGTTTIFNLNSGIYTAKVTDSKGCSTSVEINVQQPDSFIIESTQIDASYCSGCNDGSIYLNVNGGTLPYTYLWSDGDTSKNRTNLSPGYYTVTIKDRNFCSISKSFSINKSHVIYVNKLATGLNNGTNWNNAYTDLQLAINVATPNDSIWVAQGIYIPMRSAENLDSITLGNRKNSFVCKGKKMIFGGFIGNEINFSERNWKNNATILSGDLNNDDDFYNVGDSLVFINNIDNSYRVIIFADYDTYTSENSVLNGFIIQGGNANGAGFTLIDGQNYFNYKGGGIVIRTFNNAKITNCNIRYNYGNEGGGVFISNNQAMLHNCIINRNIVLNRGGGILSEYASYTLENSLLYRNKSTYFGGAIFNAEFGFMSIKNCTITKNYAGYSGSGIQNLYVQPNITNSIIWDNKSLIDSGMTSESSTVTLSHNILNDTISSGVGNVRINPDFKDVYGDDFKLLPCSPAINAGINDSVSSYNNYDINGDSRIQMGVVDIGALESSHGTPNISNSLADNFGEGWEGNHSGGYKKIKNIDCETLIDINTFMSNVNNLKAKVYLADTDTTSNGMPFVKRFYDIEVQNQPTQPSEITLYYNDADIIAYNNLVATLDTSKYPLITEGSSAVKITAYHGGYDTSSSVSIGPQKYSESNSEIIIPTSVIHDTSNNLWIVRLNTNSFSGFFLHTINDNTPLPMDIINFNVKNKISYNEIYWTTLNEDDTKSFILEKSKDGNDFTSLSEIQINGFASDYSFIDLNPFENYNFYRLKIISQNDTYKYSTILVTKNNGVKSINIYPNPARNSLNIVLMEENLKNSKIEITDITGRMSLLNFNIINSNFNIDISSLPKGIYLLNYINDKIIQSKKFIKL